MGCATIRPAWLAIAGLVGCGGAGDGGGDGSSGAPGSSGATDTATGSGDTGAATDSEASGGSSEPSGEPPLRTCGRFVVDDAGHRLKLAGVNWYGASDTEHVVGGLDVATVADVVQTIQDLGFNAVRLPFSHEMLATTDPVDAEHVAANPALQGLTPLEVFDAVVAALTEARIFVVLNSHTTHAMWCCGLDDDGVWFTSDQTEEEFIADWEMLAARYADDPWVVGADLRNELRPALRPGGEIVMPTWGGGGEADWHAAATRIGNRVLAVDPDLLVIVEGIDSADNLTGVRELPVVLDVPGKLVYQSHQYAFFPSPPGDFGNPYGEMDAQELFGASHDKWGYIMDEGKPWTAPVLLGEFGDAEPSEWLTNLGAYMAELDIDYTYWPLNGGPKASGDAEPYGLLEDDWTTVRTDARLDTLQALQPATRGPGIDAPPCR